jgi:hypothetical protein
MPYDETFIEMYGQLEGFRPRMYIYIFIESWARKIIPNYQHLKEGYEYQYKGCGSHD